MLLFFLPSCQKIVHINLNNAEKKYVVEGLVTNQPGYCRVKITQTVNFSDPNNFPPVSGAVVTVQDDNNLPVTLTENTAGIYETNVLKGTPGHTYTLSVNAGGQRFTATSQMPQQVNFDSLYTQDIEGFGATIKYANVVFKDPLGKGNAYRFIQYRNELKNKTIFVINDDFSDGRVNSLLLADFGNDNKNDEIKKGDAVKVEMQCIDAAVYKYWFSLNLSSTGSSNGNNSASPGNPVSNISGGALGYFSAQTIQTKEIIVP